ncbi:MAG: threonine-phosphate decarboxylase CobD [Clostridia bacterium]|nr:threonine-phosphate decarboxylase CobD [Clostridia bacterium]
MSKASTDIHGGNIYKASQLYGINTQDILDFSANINPLGIPDSVRKALAEGIDSLVNYPDPECIALRQGIGGYLDIPPENIIVGNGATEIVFLLYDSLKLRKVLIPAPAFAEYSKAAKASGCEIIYHEMREEAGFALEIPRLIDDIAADVDAIFICNPNNPTSSLISKSELIYLARQAQMRNTRVIVDEAFIELTCGGNENSIVQAVKEFDNIFIIRAFTKIFAIPGLRLGYGIGSSDIIGAMWERKQPWSVNNLACALGNVFRQEKEYLHRTSLWLKEEKERLFNELNRLGNLKVFYPQTNFILVKILDEGLTAKSLRDMMARRGILIRDASNFTFLDDRFVRVAVKDRASNEKLIDTFKSVLYER